MASWEGGTRQTRLHNIETAGLRRLTVRQPTVNFEVIAEQTTTLDQPLQCKAKRVQHIP